MCTNFLSGKKISSVIFAPYVKPIFHVFVTSSLDRSYMKRLKQIEPKNIYAKDSMIRFILFFQIYIIVQLTLTKIMSRYMLYCNPSTIVYSLYNIQYYFCLLCLLTDLVQNVNTDSTMGYYGFFLVLQTLDEWELECFILSLVDTVNNFHNDFLTNCISLKSIFFIFLERLFGGILFITFVNLFIAILKKIGKSFEYSGHGKKQSKQLSSFIFTISNKAPLPDD